MKTFCDATPCTARAAGVACAIGTVTLGLAYLAAAGAPMRYLAINAGALTIGLTLLALLGRIGAVARRSTSAAIVAMAGALLATALLGESVEGAARWVRLGGLTIQPSLVLLPAMLVAFARCHNTLAAAGMVVAALALAIQPDRAMAGMLAAGLAVLVLMRSDGFVVAAFCASAAGLAATLARADTLPAVAHVDGVLQSSFAVHALAGAEVLGGSALLVVPAIVGWYRDRPNRASHAAFGAVWLAAIGAAAIGNYPTPLVGYGGSAIIGYALCLVALPKPAKAHGGAAAPAHGQAGVRGPLLKPARPATA